VDPLFIALVLRYPALLQDASAQDRFFQLDVEAPFAPLYSSLISMVIEQPENDSETLIAALREEHGDAVDEVLQKAAREGLRATLDHTELSLMVQHLWPMVVNKYDLTRLLVECRHVEEELAHELNEENLHRLTHLNAHKQALEREIARYYHEDPFSIV
jgi:hypothetical protein